MTHRFWWVLSISSPPPKASISLYLTPCGPSLPNVAMSWVSPRLCSTTTAPTRTPNIATVPIRARKNGVQTNTKCGHTSLDPAMSFFSPFAPREYQQVPSSNLSGSYLFALVTNIQRSGILWILVQFCHISILYPLVHAPQTTVPRREQLRSLIGILM